MNPNYGYQLYQIQRIKARAEVLADDARRGRCAAAVARDSRRAYRKTLAWGIKDAERDQGAGTGHRLRR